MHSDQETLLSDNQRLRKSRDRWRSIAVAALLVIFVGLLPITAAFFCVMQLRHTREIVNLLDDNRELRQLLRQKGAGK
jgi:hypothetical protein